MRWSSSSSAATSAAIDMTTARAQHRDGAEDQRQRRDVARCGLGGRQLGEVFRRSYPADQGPRPAGPTGLPSDGTKVPTPATARGPPRSPHRSAPRHRAPRRHSVPRALRPVTPTALPLETYSAPTLTPWMTRPTLPNAPRWNPSRATSASSSWPRRPVGRVAVAVPGRAAIRAAGELRARRRRDRVPKRSGLQARRPCGSTRPASRWTSSTPCIEVAGAS